jgi:hypothetical protein
MQNTDGRLNFFFFGRCMIYGGMEQLKLVVTVQLP